ncbi:MAG: asparaginase [Geminicoccaceae bacterium]
MTTDVAVEVWRDGQVESRHRVAAIVVDASDRPVLSVGDVDAVVFPRSAVKPFQALPLIETGAADAYGLGDAELALACASHSGMPLHVDLVDAWLRRIGLDESDLACGPHLPSNGPAAEALLRAGLTPRRVHNNCSGKHTGMLTACLHNGWPTAGYERPDHPLQEAIRRALTEVAGIDALSALGIDGCSLPAPAMPLRALAQAVAKLADPSDLPVARAAALLRLGLAMRARPELVAGPGRCTTAVMRAVPDVIVKSGAEGVFVAALPEKGLGLALKVEDGGGRASEVALVALLGAIGALEGADIDALQPHGAPRLTNAAGIEVGHLAPAPGWPKAA